MSTALKLKVEINSVSRISQLISKGCKEISSLNNQIGNFEHLQPGRKLVTKNNKIVYSERVRMFLNDENKKVKLQTEIKMRRKQSGYKIITRSNSGAELKTVTQEDKIKMKKALGKINLLAEGSSLRIEE